MWPLGRRRQAALLRYNGSASSNLSDADALRMSFPPDAPWLAHYGLRYSVTFSNASALVAAAQPLLSATLAADSAADAAASGLSCPAEYTPSTCGACAAAGCGPILDFYASYLNAAIPGATGYEEGVGSLQTGPWGRDAYYEFLAASAPAGTYPAGFSGLSQCVAGSSNADPLSAPGLAFQRAALSAGWVVPADLVLYTAVGQQAVGGLGLKLFAAGPGFGASGWRQLLCHSLPSYGGANDSSPGFLNSMSACDFRSAPQALPAGTLLTLVSEYWADASAFPLAYPSNLSAPSPFQMPWTGAKGHMHISYALASPLSPAAAFPWLTSDGSQPPPGNGSLASA